ncbi:MAG: hypothetical protein JXA42_25140 [Anaerolineales bacterium]|nr:hypothetical protein [Anaerolineales bacterium]
MSLRKASILKLASAAYEMGLNVLRGPLKLDLNGQMEINERKLVNWLRDFQGQEIILIAASLEDGEELNVRTCRTCGRDYVEHECPHCRQARIRLRGA